MFVNRLLTSLVFKNIHSSVMCASKTCPTSLEQLSECYNVFKTVISTPQLQFLHSLFKNANYELRIAGGAVRDILNGKLPQDVDFATTATPKQMIELLNKHEERVRLIISESGIAHGTIIARIDNTQQYEVTTLRIDKKTDGRRAEVEFIKDWELDALRRDLTINSMFLDMNGNLYDYFNGVNHLKSGIIRFVGNASDRIKEDYLRILRYFRFFARYGSENHDDETLTAIRDGIRGLEFISGERLWIETKKILQHKRSIDVIPIMVDVGTLRYMGFDKDKSYDLTEFFKVHSNLYLKSSEFEPVTLFSSLLGNEDEAMNVIKRLRFSKVEKFCSLFILRHRKQSVNLRSIKTEIAISGKSEFKNLKKYALELFKYIGDYDSVEDLSNWQLPAFPVRGTSVLERISKKKLVTKVILELKTLWAKSDFSMTEDELLAEIETIVKSIPQE
ncbi:CCA tRNA nucleotidyltransferase 1: mitochondrial-like isoform X3 [Dinothrombium tinctorium]|uniref:CCA tRNA nucleotidyltransferase 1: mitochondrial-like isoform X3 n=1 Tax=Dinothrombium tinctorium TaxID=1965070 RepID=A0A3S4QCV6_9ACAR|nr:CCA tRNA nucleotidyltransferase 1: mitochondrial-like isoform X3 [Dinothrombium tinctorium]